MGLIKQKVLGLIAGYEDQNDHNELRIDGIMKSVLGKEIDLASQATMSRFENGVGIKEIVNMSYKLIDQFVQTYKDIPEKITLDIDPTDAETHGHQQGTLFHGFYMQYQYYPLLVFCDGLCIGALLRKGTVSASKYGYSMLRRIIERIRKHWPDVKIKVRGDCGFGNPKMYRICEQYGVEHEFGLSSNEVLQREVSDLYESVENAYKEKGDLQRRFKAFSYKVGSWDRARTVIGKIEHTGIGMNRRFIVVSGSVRELTEQEACNTYNNFVQRGSMEVCIDDKEGLEGLAQYIARCHISEDKILLTPDKHTVIYKSAIKDGIKKNFEVYPHTNFQGHAI